MPRTRIIAYPGPFAVPPVYGNYLILVASLVVHIIARLLALPC